MGASDDITVTLTPEVAEALLTGIGWERDGAGRWVDPSTRLVYWVTSEALTIALVRQAEDDPCQDGECDEARGVLCGRHGDPRTPGMYA